MTEINLDDIKYGDTIVVEGTAYVDGSFICLDNSVIRTSSQDEKLGRVVSHTPKTIEEPTGTGAIVKALWRDGDKNTFVRIITHDSVVYWNAEKHGVRYKWDTILNGCSNIEIVFEGVDTD